MPIFYLMKTRCRSVKAISLVFGVLIVQYAPLRSYGQGSLNISNLTELRNYLKNFGEDKSIEVKVGEIKTPLEFPIIIDGEKIRFLVRDRRGIYLATEDLPTAKRYSLAHIEPNVTDLMAAQSMRDVLVALCGKTELSTSWSLIGSGLNKDLLEGFHENNFVRLRCVYTLGNDLNFLSVALHIRRSLESLENRNVVIGSVMVTSVRPDVVHPEMDSSSE